MIHYLENNSNTSLSFFTELNSNKVVLFNSFFLNKKPIYIGDENKISIVVANSLYRNGYYNEAIDMYGKLYDLWNKDFYIFNISLCKKKIEENTRRKL